MRHILGYSKAVQYCLGIQAHSLGAMRLRKAWTPYDAIDMVLGDRHHGEQVTAIMSGFADEKAKSAQTHDGTWANQDCTSDTNQ